MYNWYIHTYMHTYVCACILLYMCTCRLHLCLILEKSTLYPVNPFHHSLSITSLVAAFRFHIYEGLLGQQNNRVGGVLSIYALMVDYQQKAVKRTLRVEAIRRGGQTFTICGDFCFICRIYVVPDMSL